MKKEHEMIMTVMEEAGKPLMAKTIARLVFDRFNGYKLPKFRVRNHLWDKHTLGPIINYNKDTYTYELQKKIEFQKKLIFDDNCIFNFHVEQIKDSMIDAKFIDYEVKGDKLFIKHNYEADNIERVLIGIVRTEIEYGTEYHKIFRRLKNNINKAFNE